jgi:hypothetical protein
VLQTVNGGESVAVYPLKPKPLIQTSLVWRKGESSRALQALRGELALLSNGKRK